MDELALEQLTALCCGKPPKGKGNGKNDAAYNTCLKPLYQVRNPKAQRHDAFHRLALLTIAKDCRESGAGQSINTAASKSLQVPSINFTLPDGQTVAIPSQNRFEVADLVFGRPLSSALDNNGNNKDKDGNGQNNNNTNPREEALAAIQKQYQSLLLTASQTEEEEEDDDNTTMGNMDDEDHEDRMDDDEKERQKQQQSSKYTEATAVGVASRRTTRGAKAAAAKKEKASPSKKQKQDNNKSTAVRFDNRVLQRACSSYLQAHMEQQLTASPVASMVCDAAFRCDRDQQASVLGNVVLCGGGACIGPTDQAVPDLLREQIEAVIHTHTPGWRVKVLSPGMQERAVCSWLGGSILGSLGTFHDMWITKAEYEEWGSAIVNRKCP
jgi:actin-related protein